MNNAIQAFEFESVVQGGVIPVPQNLISTLSNPVRVFVIQEPLPKAGESTAKPVPSLRSLRGCCKGRDTMQAYFERKARDKTKEDADRA
jgi:hypothetical protein